MLAGYLVGGIVPLLLLASTILHSVQGYFLDERKKVLLSQANVISGQVTSSEFLFDEENRSALEETILETSQEKNFRVMILDSSCLVTYDTGYEDVGKTLLLPEVVQALQHKDTAKEQKNGTVYAAASIVGAGDTRVGVVLIVDSLADVHDILGDIGREAYLLLGTLVLLVLIVMVIISKVFTEPVKNLIDVIRKMSEGHFEQRAKVRGIVHNEIVDLAISCNQMADQLEKVESSRQQFVSKGMCVDFAIHDKGDGNPHAHVMLTMRAMDEHGKWLPKSRKVYDLDENGERIRLPSGSWKSHKEDTVDWNEQYHGEEWRHGWEVVQNRYLEMVGSPERVDLRSYERQGLDILPTVHMGAAVTQMERRGIETNIGNLNRDIKAANRMIAAIRSTISGLRGWIADILEARKEVLAKLEAEKQNASPNLAILLRDYMNLRKEERRDWSRYGQQKGTADDLKAVSQAVVYLKAHELFTLEDLDEALQEVNARVTSTSTAMKKAEKRMQTITGIQKAVDTCQTHKAVHDKYLRIGWKARQAVFAETHKDELDSFNKAYRYLKKQGVDLNVDLEALQTEYDSLQSSHEELAEQLVSVKEELKPMKEIRYWVGKVLTPEQAEVEKKPEPKHSVTEQMKYLKEQEKQTPEQKSPRQKQQNMEL